MPGRSLWNRPESGQQGNQPEQHSAKEGAFGTAKKKSPARGDFFTRVGRPADLNQAQEKPPLVEQPDRAPAGIEEEPELILKPAAEIVFRTLVPPHLSHLTSPLSLHEVEITSKTLLHSKHLYSYIGIFHLHCLGSLDRFKHLIIR